MKRHRFREQILNQNLPEPLPLSCPILQLIVDKFIIAIKFFIPESGRSRGDAHLTGLSCKVPMPDSILSLPRRCPKGN